MTFNLKKQSQVDPYQQMMADVPYGYNPMAVKWLWNQMYENDPLTQTVADMLRNKSPEEIQAEYDQLSNPELVEDLPEEAALAEDAKGAMEDAFASVKKPFNFKKAQIPMPAPAPMPSPMPVGSDELEMQQQVEPTKTYETHNDLNNMLVEVANSPNAFQTSWNNILKENPQEADSAQAALKSYFQGFEMKGPEQQLKDAEIIHELIYGKEDIMPIDAEYKELGASVSEASNIIKKIAQKTISKNKKKAYNLTKTAQHKTLDNAILYGPGETRIDPFLHQPVSDWHIVERNKGFGLVVDDVWNIDYETIWRENVMDKYSRPYRNKEGEWVGGYIQKRFEVDKNIPETSNMQLKPGQLRRPILPEYGNTESRLQAARAKGDIAGAIDTSKPFNWKEASSKKKS
jgi:hypothetical protein